MFRQDSYVEFWLPSVGKLVFVCNEEGNATYVLDSAVDVTWLASEELTKDRLKEQGAQKLIWTNDHTLWKEKL